MGHPLLVFAEAALLELLSAATGARFVAADLLFRPRSNNASDTLFSGEREIHRRESDRRPDGSRWVLPSVDLGEDIGWLGRAARSALDCARLDAAFS